MTKARPRRRRPTAIGCCTLTLRVSGLRGTASASRPRRRRHATGTGELGALPAPGGCSSHTGSTSARDAARPARQPPAAGGLLGGEGAGRREKSRQPASPPDSDSVASPPGAASGDACIRGYRHTRAGGTASVSNTRRAQRRLSGCATARHRCRRRRRRQTSRVPRRRQRARTPRQPRRGGRRRRPSRGQPARPARVS